MSARLRILILDDSATDSELLERELSRSGLSFDVARAQDRASYIAALATPPDLVVSDFDLQEFDGLEALRLLKQRYAQVPFILVSGAIGEELAVTAMREGAADYLLKDRLSRLGAAVASTLGRAQLQEEKRQLEERLLRADRLESLGQLASGVAHDLNNLLLPILMAAELLEEQVPSAERELLRVIRGNAERGSKLLKQLLTFGRGSAGARSPLRLASAVDEIMPILNTTFPKSVHIKRDIQAADSLVVADPTQLQQVLMNLCVNARDAMPSGGELLIRVSREEVPRALSARHPGSEPGRYAVLSVKDAGVGMDPGQQARIFEPFYSTKAADRGTGLGLSSVFGIVKAHRGFVEVQSKPGEGSEFRVFIPECGVSEQQGVAEGPRLRQSNTEQVVLLVDDEPSILQGLRACAAHQGYRVVTASDGESALARLSEDQGRIGVVVTDLAMPQMNGMSLIREIRARGRAVEVVVMLGGAPDHAQLEELGVRHVLQKPFGLPKLGEALEAAFSERRETRN